MTHHQETETTQKLTTVSNGLTHELIQMWNVQERKGRETYTTNLHNRPKECDSLFRSFCILERAPLFFSRIVTPDVGRPTPANKKHISNRSVQIFHSSSRVQALRNYVTKQCRSKTNTYFI